MDDERSKISEFFETTSLGSPENAVGFVLWRVMHRYQREVDRVLGPLNLTHLQFTTLALVAWFGRSGAIATQADLARSGDIHPMQVSHMLKTLEAKVLVKRTSSRTNAVAKQAGITPEGLSVLRRAMPLVIDVQERLFGDEGRPGGPLLTSLLRVAGNP